jgi:hypothetical protein
MHNQGFTIMTTRSLSIIARDIKADWEKPYFGAVPYIDALSQLNEISDRFYSDSAKGVVLYFLANASSWRGETAKRIKSELKTLAGIK